MRIKLTEEDLEDYLYTGGFGYCISCGEESGSYCEPDLRRARCYNCENHTVYGLEELLIMDMVDIIDDYGD